VDAALPADVTIEFHGQTGRLICVAPIPDAEATRRAAEQVAGVHSVSLDATCTGGAGAGTTSPVVDSISSDSGTLPPRSDGSTTTADTAPTTAVSVSSPASSTTVAPATTTPPADVSLVFQNGALQMLGKVASADQHAALLIAAAEVLDPANITDGLDVDGSVAISNDDVARMAAVVRAMTVPLASGEVDWRPDGLSVRGSFTDEAALAALQAALAAAGVTDVTLVPRHVASDAEAVALQTEMNALVAASPIEFDKGQTTLSASSAAIVERVAGLAKRFDGVVITVQGHTDSEGDAGRNLTLSEQRADAVRTELGRLGVPADVLTSVGYGETQLVVDPNGSELPDKSRRVVFTVTTTSG
jgi:OOP family OmpA-OmpF porin